MRVFIEGGVSLRTELVLVFGPFAYKVIGRTYVL
jgi:hypothetical protein